MWFHKNRLSIYQKAPRKFIYEGKPYSQRELNKYFGINKKNGLSDLKAIEIR